MKNVGLHHKDLLYREGVPFSQEGGANAKILIFSARATKKFMSRAKTGFTSSFFIKANKSAYLDRQKCEHVWLYFLLSQKEVKWYTWNDTLGQI